MCIEQLIAKSMERLVISASSGALTGQAIGIAKPTRRADGQVVEHLLAARTTGQMRFQFRGVARGGIGQSACQRATLGQFSFGSSRISPGTVLLFVATGLQACEITAWRPVATKTMTSSSPGQTESTMSVKRGITSFSNRPKPDISGQDVSRPG